MFNKILLPIDGSESAEHAMTYALEQASTFSAELIIITVVPPTSALLFGDDDFPTINIEDYEKAMEESHKEVLTLAVERVKKSNPELKTKTVLDHGHVGISIVNIAKKEDVDLIVMGDRGLSGVSEFLLGSTSRYVVEHCIKPIMIVK